MSRVFKRRTVPMGVQIGDLSAPRRYREYSDEMHVREMNFNAGGIGSALWDSSIILARFINHNGFIFKGKVVHEIGAGIGLPALYAAKFAKRSISSDYLPILLDNYNVNISMNACLPLTSLETAHHHFPVLKAWRGVYANQQREIDQVDYEDEHGVKQPGDDGYNEWKHEMDRRFSPIPLDSYFDGEPDSIPFVPNVCLSHHDECGCIGLENPLPLGDWDPIRDEPKARAWQEEYRKNIVASSQGIVLDWLKYPQLPQRLRDDLKCDIILGSEVSYIQIRETMESLLFLIHDTLSPSGVFYLVQSPERGTAAEFINILCTTMGFVLDIRAVPEEELEQFSSGQRRENYLYYTFRRKGSPFPIMGEGCNIIDPPDGVSAEALQNINI